MQGEGNRVATEITADMVIEVSEVVPRHPADLTGDLVIDLRPELDDTITESSRADIADGVDAEAQTGPAAPGPLHGRVAVVTGGANGVGREVALGLARSGARVCVLGRELAQLRETVELAGPEAAILFLQCDVGSLSEIEGVVDFIERFDRPVDILVHAEGVQVRGGIEHGSVNDLDEQYLVNVRGPYLMSQRLLAQLRAGRGHVVFVNPAPSSEGAIDFGQFAVTTDSVRSLADTLRREVQTSGVRVTSIRPEAPTTDVAAETVVALSPHDIADSVLHAVQVPGQVEITDITLRPRSA